MLPGPAAFRLLAYLASLPCKSSSSRCEVGPKQNYTRDVLQWLMYSTDAQDEKDKMGPDNTMKYLETIGVNLEDASMFIVLEIVKAETIGEIKKDGFVSGWAEAG